MRVVSSAVGAFRAAAAASTVASSALQVGQRVRAGDGFDAAHASGHAAFGHDLEQADVARALHVGAAAQLAAGANVQHAHGFAVLLAKQHHRAGGLGRFDVHHAGIGGGVGQNFLRSPALRSARICSAVTGALCVKSKRVRSALTKLPFCCTCSPSTSRRALCMMCVTEWLRMVAARSCGIHLGLHRIAHLQAALGQHAVVAKHIGLDLLRVFHGKAAGCQR